MQRGSPDASPTSMSAARIRCRRARIPNPSPVTLISRQSRRNRRHARRHRPPLARAGGAHAVGQVDSPEASPRAAQKSAARIRCPTGSDSESEPRHAGGSNHEEADAALAAIGVGSACHTLAWGRQARLVTLVQALYGCAPMTDERGRARIRWTMPRRHARRARGSDSESEPRHPDSWES